MTKYRKKPVEIEAKQVPPAPRSEPVPDDLQGVALWCGGHVMSNTSSGEYCIDMSLNRLRALPGDWIVKEVNGEFNVRTSEFFEATYEIVGEELEAKLAKVVELALEECPFRWGTPNYDTWWRHYRTTLAELKGQDDE